MSDEKSTGAVVALPENFFDPIIGDIAKVIPQNTITAEALTRIVVMAMNKQPELRQCSRGSILTCVMDVGSVGLIPNTPQGFAYIIPYRNKGKMEATLQIGYRGFCELSYRSGQVKIIQADVVRQDDDFEYEKGTETHLRHKKDLSPGRRERAVIAAWAIVELISGGRNIEVMDAEELVRIQKQAERFKASPAWQHWPDEQRKKTALKRLLKILQIGSMPQLQKALEIEAKTFQLPSLEDTTPSVPHITSTDPPPPTAEKPAKGKRGKTEKKADAREVEPAPVGFTRDPDTKELIDAQGNFVW